MSKLTDEQREILKKKNREKKLKENQLEKLIKKAKWPLLILGFFHLILEVVIQDPDASSTSRGFPVVINYLISSSILKYRIKNEKTNNIFIEGPIIYIIVLAIRIVLGIIVFSFI